MTIRGSARDWLAGATNLSHGNYFLLSGESVWVDPSRQTIFDALGGGALKMREWKMTE